MATKMYVYRSLQVGGVVIPTGSSYAHRYSQNLLGSFGMGKMKTSLLIVVVVVIVGIVVVAGAISNVLRQLWCRCRFGHHR